METDPDEMNRPDEIDRADEIAQPEFGEHDDQAQEAEWTEDAREGGTSE